MLSRQRDNVHGPERSESEDLPATAARGALTAPRSSSPPLPPPPRHPLPLLARPSSPRAALGAPRSRGPESSPPSAGLAGRRASLAPHYRPFHPRLHPTLRSSRESFFLTSRPSRLPWRCVSRLISFFSSPSSLPFFLSFFIVRSSRAGVLIPVLLAFAFARPRFLGDDTRSTRRVSDDYGRYSVLPRADTSDHSCCRWTLLDRDRGV